MADLSPDVEATLQQQIGLKPLPTKPAVKPAVPPVDNTGIPLAAAEVMGRRESAEQDIKREADEAVLKEQQKVQNGYFSIVSGAFVNESLAGGILKAVGEEFTTGTASFNPDFKASEAIPKELLKQYPTGVQEYILEAKNQDELNFRIGTAADLQNYNKTIQAYGFKSLPGVMVGAVFGDPSTYLTGGYGMIGKPAKAAKFTSLLTESMLAAGFDEVAAKSVQPQKNWSEVALAALSAGVFQVGLRPVGKAVGRAFKETADLDKAGTDVVSAAYEDSAKATFRESIISKGKVPKPKSVEEELWVDKFVDDVFKYTTKVNEVKVLETELVKQREALTLIEPTDPARIDAEKIITENEAVLTKATTELETLKKPEYTIGGEKTYKPLTHAEAYTEDEVAFLHDAIRQHNELKPYITNLSKTIAGQGISSDNEVTSKVMYLLCEYAPGFRGKYSRGRTVSAYRDILDRDFVSTWAPKMQEAEADFIKVSRVNPFDRFRHAQIVEDFNLKIQRELDNRRFDEVNSLASKSELTPAETAVKNAADAMSEARTKMYMAAVENGVKRFQKAGFRENTLARKWVPSNFLNMAKDPQMGWSGIEELLHKGIRKAIAHMTPEDEVSERISRAWANAIVRRNRENNKAVRKFTTDLLSVENRPFIERVLADAGVDDIQKETFLRAIDKSRAMDSSQSVIEMSLNTSHKGHDIWELLDPNLTANLTRESKRMAGEIALAKGGFKSDTDFNNMLDLVSRHGITKGLSRESIEKDVKYLDAARKLILGETLEADPSGTFAKGATVLRDAVQLGILNWAGFAQLSEIGKVGSRLGVASIIKQVPMLGTLRRELLSGKLNNKWLADLEEAGFGRIGDDHLLNNPRYRLDANNLGVEATWDSKGAQRFHNVIKRLKHYQGFINGMNHIKRFEDRLLLSGLSQKVAKLIDSDSLPEGQLKRLVDIGIDKPMIGRIRKQLIAQNWQENGNMGVAKWTDIEAQDTMLLALNRAWGQDIQRTAVGEQYLWTTSTIGKLLSQFRGFPLAAIEKQSLHSLRMMDIEAFMITAWGMAFGTAAYLARAQVQALGEDNPKKFLKERLQLRNIVAGGANLVGQSSMAPELFHAVGWLTGQEDYDLFRYSMDRGTGITRKGHGIDIGRIAPSAGYLNRFFRVLQNATRAAIDDEFQFSRRDAEDVVKTTWLLNNVATGALFKHILKDLPDNNYQ